MDHTLDYKSPPKYTSYKKRAEERFSNHEFITKDQFTSISNAPCFYCGKDGPNGIDRLDNNVGYTRANCVPACKHCNYVKGDLSLELFTEWKTRFIKKQVEDGCGQ